ncbi:MAG TPA: glycosyltransferase family 9 protein [Deltaproteobacteria bacterium]|nr:glycosyltransferase family 9 protein [Deltaproteobacteria bacterium]OQC27535.1 MAG: Lipopolysaccharide core heptosyltransferase RfaQ [Deltaproteobacteria bacterium ADurb.Bin072]HRW80079.1 glycosyltransferase family 9 protein [Desulfomonilia bacterium]HNQ86383.1 glycosyltransferase family 9 protein [Deltaproteobacteria bacterium]HNS90775.1 glycosyltransferase family 9 protein [Deltaproteobacteria bacterium]
MGCHRICVIHLNQIGDLVFSLPLLKALRDHYPNAAIHSVARPYLHGLLEDSPLVDRIVTRRDTLPARASLLWTLRRQHYDLLISLPRSEEALILAGLSGARIKAGFAHRPWDAVLDVKEVIQGHNSWFNNARILARLGIPVVQDNYVGLLQVDGLPDVKGLPWRYAVISPGASRRRLAKAWDEEKFARVIAQLSMEFGLSCVLVGGNDTAECTGTIVAHVERLLSGGVLQVRDLAGKISLRELAAVLKKAKLFVGIDSGVMHMASALDIPTVGIFGPTDPFYVAPQNARSMVVRKDMACSPCYLRGECEHRRCLQELGADAVVEACRRVMGA